MRASRQGQQGARAASSLTQHAVARVKVRGNQVGLKQVIIKACQGCRLAALEVQHTLRRRGAAQGGRPGQQVRWGRGGTGQCPRGLEAWSLCGTPCAQSCAHPGVALRGGQLRVAGRHHRIEVLHPLQAAGAQPEQVQGGARSAQRESSSDGIPSTQVRWRQLPAVRPSTASHPLLTPVPTRLRLKG